MLSAAIAGAEAGKGNRKRSAARGVIDSLKRAVLGGKAGRPKSTTPRAKTKKANRSYVKVGKVQKGRRR